MRLKNKVCIITGSSSGIGASFAEAFIKEGANVVFTYNNNKKKAHDLMKRYKSFGMRLDVTNRKSVKNLFEKVYKRFGRIDVLINNAGVNKTADFDKLTDKDWDFVLDTNLKGVFVCCQESLKYLKKGSKIINIGSLSGEYGGPRTVSYAAAKAGVMSLTHCLARFLGKKGICVNCLSPGVIGNEFTEKTMSKDVKKLVNNLILLGRLGKLEDLNGAAIFLASDEANYITGQTISVNGGAWVR